MIFKGLFNSQKCSYNSSNFLSGASMRYVIFFLVFLSSIASFADSPCPRKLINLILSCSGHAGGIHFEGFQFLNHAGAYRLVEDSVTPGNNPDQKVVSCSYMAEKWFSTYRLNGQTVQITNTEEIAGDIAQKFSTAISRFKLHPTFSDEPTINMQYSIQDGHSINDSNHMLFYISLGFDTVYNGDSPYFTKPPKEFSKSEMFASLQNQNSPESMINTRVMRSDRFDERNDPSSTYPTGKNCQISIE
jgi:hypothetical protein